MFTSYRTTSMCGLLLFVALCLRSGGAHALVIQVAGSSTLELPIFVLPKNSIPLELELRIVNNESEDDVTVLLWQLALRPERETGATGDLQFVSLAAAENSLFGSDPGPITFDELPTNNMIASEIDPEFVGAPIGIDVAAPIAEIGLLPADDASGLFALTMDRFDQDAPDQTSYWSSDEYEPTPFGNPFDNHGNVLLAYIYVIEAGSVAGDFSGNRTVDAADYTIWRDQLGISFSDVHYRIWKQHFGRHVMDESISLSVPEPLNLWLLSIAALIALRAHRQMNRN